VQQKKQDFVTLAINHLQSAVKAYHDIVDHKTFAADNIINGQLNTATFQ
jgi:hypothetical protein